VTYQGEKISESEAVSIPVAYDYKNQAWLHYGHYLLCGHSEDFPCKCYGKIHAGSLVASDADLA